MVMVAHDASLLMPDSPLEGRVYELAAAPPGEGGRGAAARRAAHQRHGAAEGVSCAARHHHPGPGLDTRSVRRHCDMAWVYYLLIWREVR